MGIVIKLPEGGAGHIEKKYLHSDQLSSEKPSWLGTGTLVRAKGHLKKLVCEQEETDRQDSARQSHIGAEVKGEISNTTENLLRILRFSLSWDFMLYFLFSNMTWKYHLSWCGSLEHSLNLALEVPATWLSLEGLDSWGKDLFVCIFVLHWMGDSLKGSRNDPGDRERLHISISRRNNQWSKILP